MTAEAFDYSRVTSHLDTRYLPRGDNIFSFSGAAHLSRYAYVVREVLGGKKSDLHLLDFGCGAGYGTALLADYCADIIGVDLSAVAIDYASAEFLKPNLRFLVADVEDGRTVERLHRSGFDLIVSFDVIEHLKDPRAYLRNAYELLKTNGVFVIGTPNRLMTLKYNKTWNPYHRKEYSPGELEGELKKIFQEVTLFGQDLREGIRERVQRDLRLNLLGRILRKALRILKIRPASEMRIKEEDMVFAPSSVDSAFGIMAVARKTR